MIELKNVTIAKSGKSLFKNLNLTIQDKEHLVIRGKNGSGKTALLELIAGVITPTDGEIHYDFINGETWEDRFQQRKKLIHYIACDAALTHIHQHDLFYQQRYYSLGDEFVPTVHDFLGDDLVAQLHRFDFPASLSIDHLLSLKLTRLSNGQQKRVVILKTLALQMPRLLLLDYPFEALDRQSRRDFAAFLDVLVRHYGVQLILTDHDDQFPESITHSLLIHDSKVLRKGLFADKLPEVTKEKTVDEPISDEVIVQMKDLTIQYGKTVIIKGLNWSIKKGERWALMGKNGSGKTTLFSLIFADHPLAYSQEVFLFGKRRGSGESIWDIKNRITYLGPEQMSYLDPNDKLFTARQFILRQTKYPNVEKLEKLIDYFESAAFIDKPLRMLSSGQVQLVFIIQAFIVQKELLLFDEPFRFLDSLQKFRVNEYLQTHLDASTTLVMITHDEHDLAQWGKQVMQL